MVRQTLVLPENTDLRGVELVAGWEAFDRLVGEVQDRGVVVEHDVFLYEPASYRPQPWGCARSSWREGDVSFSLRGPHFDFDTGGEMVLRRPTIASVLDGGL